MVNIPDDSIHSFLQVDMTGTMEGPEGGDREDRVHLTVKIDGENHLPMLLDRPFQQGIISGWLREDDIKNHRFRLFQPFEKG